jgi:hypothetical protein
MEFFRSVQPAECSGGHVIHRRGCNEKCERLPQPPGRARAVTNSLPPWAQSVQDTLQKRAWHSAGGLLHCVQSLINKHAGEHQQ